ncbi:hypothetical protein QBC35DRAFT_42930 [Podospora australis]|uniref:ATP synthase assembly factor FMC1, mitochondrial n=1 Tax=Podospora australis TaxID=1536484 RepID=A0AAN7AJE5_9PEZI|nr:hypothetical protein QBC35DRAFT_42930 [Podospora australis]
MVSKPLTSLAQAATKQPLTLAQAYRGILHELPPRPIIPRNTLAQTLRENIAKDVKRFDGDKQKAAELPEEYLAYLKAQREYVTLVERYNPGMGMDEETRVRLTARRVGMDLPKEYGNGEEGGEKK